MTYNKVVYALILACIFLIDQAIAQSKNSFDIKSSYTKDSYNIEVFYPADFDSSKSYPVVYCLDWRAYEGLIVNTYGLLEYSNQVEPLVLVGISNSGGWATYFADRARDFTPVHIPELDVESLKPESNSGITGGGESFLLFLKQELIPEVEKLLNEKPGKRGIVGYSYGGLFATTVLTIDPGLFQKYLIGSPSLWYDDFKIVENLGKKGGSNITNGTSIHLSVGELEGGNQLKGYGALSDAIMNIDKDISTKSEIIQDEGHSTAVVISYLKGIRYLYQSGK